MWAKRYSMKKRKTVGGWVSCGSQLETYLAGERTGSAAKVGVALSLVEAEVGILVDGVTRGALCGSMSP